MQFKQKSSICPKTGRIIKSERKYNFWRWLFPLTGLAAFIWFLIRVIPKPSRAAYPCQRAAFPFAAGFIVWLLGLAGSAAAFRKAKNAFSRARYFAAAVFAIISIYIIFATLSATDDKTVYAHQPRIPNNVLGQGKGVYPGRVAWIHDAAATNWAGPGFGQYWYSNSCTSQQVVDEMLSKALRSLTGKSSDYAAWDSIFRNFNQQAGKGNVGYTPGEKIAIKANFTLMHSNPTDMEKPISYIDHTDNSPQLAIAMLKQLTNVVGISPGNISIGDPTRMMPNYWYNMVGPSCPGVVYLTNSGYSGCGRVTVTPDYSSPFYWSDPCSAHFSGVTNQDYIPSHFSQANYFINFPILKSHDSGGITVCGKNLYGALIRSPADSGYFNMHLSWPSASSGMGKYRATVDLMSHPRLGGKTILALIDGLYGGVNWDSTPVRWQMAPFNNDWPSSIIVSQDQVAADSVAADFMYNEWTTYPRISGVDDYLHETALLPNPPSGVLYDPNHSGSSPQSLGVHEHWNNAVDKKYSRNLDPVNGTGIELVTSADNIGDINNDGKINFKDYAILAKAWRTTAGQVNWNPACDISVPSDNVINYLDLSMLCENWLQE